MAGKISDTPPRVPEPVCGIQVNFCKNIECANFGRPASPLPQKRGRGQHTSDRYVITTKKKFRKAIQCKHCKQYSMLKSNQGIYEELNRISDYLDITPTIVGCPSDNCVNSIVDVKVGSSHYHRKGVTEVGSQRYRCKACGITFSVPNRPINRQRLSHKNKTILKLLMNKEPFSRICEVTEISMPTLYDKIDFLHRQCLLFIADRETSLLNGKIAPERLYLQTDRQDYFVNWTNTFDKRNVVLRGIGTADSLTGYVFGMHVNYDPTLDPAIVQLIVQNEEIEFEDLAFREFARVWIEVDHKRSERKPAKPDPDPIPQGKLLQDIADRYAAALERDEIEASDEPEECTRLPMIGMQIHEEYTLYGHFFFLKRLLAHAGKIRFFLDQESGIRAACLSAFCDEILEGRCDAFYVRINKNLTVHQKQKVVRFYKYEMEKHRHKYPYLQDVDIHLNWIRDEMKRLKMIGKWNDRWLDYPFPNMSEPEKAICYLTDRKDYEEDHLARLYYKASLHKIDSYFNQIRSRINPLSRPVKSMSNQGRSFHRYQLYNPALAQKLLDIFRVYHNYHLKSPNSKDTPAMRLGLARASISVDEIINFRPGP